VEDTGDIQHLLGSAKVGDTVQAKVLRGGSPVMMSIALADRPTR
jgi:S1-C subfamily serine protease